MPEFLVLILCVALLSVLVTLALRRRTKKRWWHDDEKFEQVAAEQRAANEFEAAARRFNAWRDARPLLYVGQSEYSRALVRELIRSYEHILALGIIEDDGTLSRLYELLNEGPPHPPPPGTTKPRSAGLSSCFF